jgi:drug/metabolite transporter (DMT)-like permease
MIRPPMPGLLERSYLLLPLTAAFLYALGALGAKAAGTRGLDFVRITVVCNWTMAIGFAAFVRPADGLLPDALWKPALIGLAFLGGQVFTFVALRRGDVSLATPLMGTKVVMVAIFLATVFGRTIEWQTWAGALVAVAGIVLLQTTHRGAHWSHVTVTLFSALAAAACYAIFDCMIATWSPAAGFGRLVPPGVFFAAVLAMAILPFAGGSWRAAPRAAYGYLLLGSALIAGQALLLVGAIGFWHDAARCNIVYGSRGMWSVVLVYAVGHHFGNTEREAGGGVFVARLSGSVLILAAIVLAFV